MACCITGGLSLTGYTNVPTENPNWHNNAIQFPRLIEEAQAAGAFTEEVIADMAVSMDLSVFEVNSLINRAQEEWDRIKEETCPIG